MTAEEQVEALGRVEAAALKAERALVLVDARAERVAASLERIETSLGRIPREIEVEVGCVYDGQKYAAGGEA